MNSTLGLFTIDTRVQPALPESYIVTVRISEEPKGFYTRLYSLHQNKYVYLRKLIKKRMFKEDLFFWEASFDAIHERKKVVFSKNQSFGRIMAFNFKNEIDMMDGLYTLKSFLDEVFLKEFIEFQMAVNSEDRTREI